MLWAIILSQYSYASQFPENLKKAREAYLKKNEAEMTKQIVLAKRNATEIKEIVNPSDLAFLYYISGGTK